jgi:hypothetical protein
MITSFQVGAVFEIINKASPALAQILKQVRDLNVQLDKARANLASLGKSVVPVGLTSAVAQTDALATAWGNVAKNAGAAQIAIGRAAARSALPPVAGGGGGAARVPGGHRPGGLGGAHVYGPSARLPGGTHVSAGRMGGGGGAAMAGAGLAAYSVYEAAEIEKYVFQLLYHSGLESNDANKAKFRKIIQDAMISSGYGVKEISESALQEVRMFKGTPGGGIDVLPEMLRAATTEAMLKGGSTPQEAMTALIGLSHMTKEYSPEAIKKLAPAFAFLSTSNPARLASIERSAGYAVPLLQSGLDIDPMTTLLLGTALTRAGATNTKSGTWLREMALRAMPGTSLMSKMAFKKHEAALKEIGLVDEAGKPTWFTDGKPDLLKMLDIGGEGAAKVPIERRAAIERSLFGAQGGGGFALLADPKVREQIQALQSEMQSPEFKNRYATFQESYKEGSTAQMARTAMAEFNVTMMELGKDILPAVNVALKDFKNILQQIRAMMPGGTTSTVGARALEGALVGGAAGLVGGPGGALGGALLGGIAGGVLGTAESFMKEDQARREQGLRAYERPGDRYQRRIDKLNESNAAPKAVLPPISLSLNIDGRSLAQAVSDELGELHEHATGAPAANGQAQFGRADGGLGTD